MGIDVRWLFLLQVRDLEPEEYTGGPLADAGSSIIEEKSFVSDSISLALSSWRIQSVRIRRRLKCSCVKTRHLHSPSNGNLGVRLKTTISTPPWVVSGRTGRQSTTLASAPRSVSTLLGAVRVFIEGSAKLSKAIPKTPIYSRALQALQRITSKEFSTAPVRAIVGRHL